MTASWLATHRVDDHPTTTTRSSTLVFVARIRGMTLKITSEERVEID